jgi:hypothetical protein
VAATTPKHLDAAHAPFKLQRQRAACAAAFPQIEYGITLAATTTSSAPSIGFASAVWFLVDHPKGTAQTMPCLERPTLALSHQNRWGCLVRAGPVSTSEQNPLAGPLVSKAGSGEGRTNASRFAFCLLIGFKSSPSRAVSDFEIVRVADDVLRERSSTSCCSWSRRESVLTLYRESELIGIPYQTALAVSDKWRLRGGCLEDERRGQDENHRSSTSLLTRRSTARRSFSARVMVCPDFRIRSKNARFCSDRIGSAWSIATIAYSPARCGRKA